MSEINSEVIQEQTETLLSEVKHFANQLPYWGKFLASKIFQGSEIDDTSIDDAYNLLLQDLGLLKMQEREAIDFEEPNFSDSSFGNSVIFEKLENLEGVNALCEGQQLTFDNNLTMVFGGNGAGKSGYVRLLKQVFHSRFQEDIKANIHSDSPKETTANFLFNKDGINLPLSYPDNQTNAILSQFAVFDGKSAEIYLTKKNEFNFRPSGLNFFGLFNDAINKLEQKLRAEIDNKQIENNLTALFEDESEIKTFVSGLTKNTTKEDIEKYIPFTQDDADKKTAITKDFDELSIKASSRTKEVKELENITRLLSAKKTEFEKLNTYFTQDKITAYNNLTSKLKEFEELAKNEGLSNFKDDNITGIGSQEWKDFIQSARKFALQKGYEYPNEADTCVFCNQPLTENAKNLINKYWVFIKSEAEQNLNKQKEIISRTINVLKGLDFNLLQEESVLGAWLMKNHEDNYLKLSSELNSLKEISEGIVTSLENNRTIEQKPFSCSVNVIDDCSKIVKESIEALKSDEILTQLAKLKKQKVALLHKEKYNEHVDKINGLVLRMRWVDKAEKANFEKRKITDTEKSLSNKYFNEEYVNTFNGICTDLKGEFGISISHTGSGGTSFRRLNLKGNSPSAILSEGEQKVIAIADFLAEMTMSEINQGLVFDDPVNSLDDDRKEIIAQRIVKECVNKQVIVFTHDKPFFHHLSNACEKQGHSLQNHMIESIGKVYLGSSPRIEAKYKSTTIPQEYLRKSKNAAPDERAIILAHGFASLATCYEYHVKNVMLKSIINPFDKHIKLSKIKDIKLDQTYSDKFVEHYGNVCDLKEGHLPCDSYSNSEINSDLLEQEINKFNQLKEEYKAL